MTTTEDTTTPFLLIGCDLISVRHDAAMALHQARPEGYEFVTTIIPIDENEEIVTNRSDIMALDSRWWRTSIVGIIICVVEEDVLSSKSKTTTTTDHLAYYTSVFGKSFQWALHMDLPAIILPTIPTSTTTSHTTRNLLVSSYASALVQSIVTHRIDRGHNLNVWMPISISDLLFQSNPFSHYALEVLQQQVLQPHSCVSIMLVLETMEHTVPTTSTGDVRWYVAECWRRIHLLLGRSHQLAAIVLPTDIFLTNKRGFPTLSKAHQHLLAYLLRRIGRTLKIIVQSKHNDDDPTTVLLPNLTKEQLGQSKTLPYYQYLQHFRSTRSEITNVLDTPLAKMEREYLDALQKPLQPLADHLEFQTYEVFERDPIKYAQYEKAVYLAMYDYLVSISSSSLQTITTTTTADSMVTQQDTQNMDEDNDKQNHHHHHHQQYYRVLVAGAGRGPLVHAVIRAIQNLQRDHLHPLPQVWIYAVEKNPSAIFYLRSKHKQEWSQLASTNHIHVRIVESDLRCLQASTLFAGDSKSQSSSSSSATANLIVSELLGSFGCNELSPECLDDLMHKTDVCNRQTTKSIPARYTSFAAPVSSMHLFHAVQQQALYPAKNPSYDAVMVGRTRAFETPYVVRPHAASQIYSASQCWSFSHPSPVVVVDAETTTADHVRSRSCHLSFGNDPTYGAAYGSGYGCTDPLATSLFSSAEVQDMLSQQKPLSWMCTGILGTFTADLYFCERTKEMIQISTVPDTFSDGMFSWFPLYFPLSQPVLVPAGAILQVQIWRKVSATKVWYEWSVIVTEQQQQQQEEVVGDRANRLLYASPIHNPGGRSYYVSLL
jgi:protein arginine N-methyltransferase 5